MLIAQLSVLVADGIQIAVGSGCALLVDAVAFKVVSETQNLRSPDGGYLNSVRLDCQMEFFQPLRIN